MNTTFTPGPWSRDKYGHIVSAGNFDVLFRSVSILSSSSPERMAEAEANTTLAAAAPDLLACLLEAQERPLITEGSDWWVRVNAAIAKATGGTQ